MKGVWKKTGRLTWDTVSNQFSPICMPTVDYVEGISRTPTIASQPQ